MPPTELQTPAGIGEALPPGRIGPESCGDVDFGDVAMPPTNLPYDDGEPLESFWHSAQIQLLIAVINCARRGRNDYFAGNNMFVYYDMDQVRNRNYRGPDFFLANDVLPKEIREYWATWEEGGKYPDLIVELMSPSTRKEDLTTKYKIYEKIFSTSEYVAYDPVTREIHAWLKLNGEFVPMVKNERGHVFLKSADFWLGKWRGTFNKRESTWLRFFDSEGNLVLHGEEAEALRADEAAARAVEAASRADALAAELAALKAKLANPS